MKKIVTALTATAAFATVALSQEAEASTYKVKSGDSLWKLANDNNTTVDKLKSLNNLSSNTIYINQNIVVAEQEDTYTVKSGDTLSKIASQYGMNYRTLMSINGITSHLIYPGQVLNLKEAVVEETVAPAPEDTTVPEPEVAATEAPAESEVVDGVYTVKLGDTLGKIGSKLGVSYQQIATWNGIANPDFISVGQKLIVDANYAPVVEAEPEYVQEVVEEVTQSSEPVVEEATVIESTEVETVVEEAPVVNEVVNGAYTVQAGDTLGKISGTFGVTTSQLKEWNGLGNSDLIKAGQKLIVDANYAPVVEEVVQEVVEPEQVQEVVEEVVQPEPVQEVVEEVVQPEPVQEVVEEVVEPEPVQEVVEPTPVVYEVVNGAYTVQAGDTLGKISGNFGVSTQQIKQWNGLGNSDFITAGQKLIVDANYAPVVEVEAPQAEVNVVDNTAAERAAAERAAAEQRAAEERAAAERAAAEQRAAEERAAAERAAAEQRAAEERAAAERAAAEQRAAEERAAAERAAAAPAPVQNNFSWGVNYYRGGQCTWYAFERRKQLGKPLANNWGNAATWANSARNSGYSVSYSPSVGAVMHFNYGQGGASSYYGHVAVVERINADGSIQISEANWSGGPYGITYRTIPASQVNNHQYIH